jgi:hypothetical protein
MKRPLTPKEPTAHLREWIEGVRRGEHEWNGVTKREAVELLQALRLCDELRMAGRATANACFNLSQSDRLTAEERASLEKAYRAWDWLLFGASRRRRSAGDLLRRPTKSTTQSYCAAVRALPSSRRRAPKGVRR